MKTIKVAEATGPVLDWLVAKCERYDAAFTPAGDVIILREGVTDYFDPHRNWGWGGPIIQREQISVDFDADPARGGPCAASTRDSYCYWVGPTPLIAAMRCFASKLGDEVDIPEGLV